MSAQTRPRPLLTLLAVVALALGAAACGGDGDEAEGFDTDENLIERNPRNADVRITVGSR